MAITTSKSLEHWNYFLALEKDLENLSRYIEFCKPNFNCYSLEMARVLLASASEVDVVAKQLCRKLDPDSSADNIHQYRNEIKIEYPQILDFKVNIPRYGLTFTPWLNWKKNQGVPIWWTAYNKVKHHRNIDFKKANLENILKAVAGLFIITLYFYKEKAESTELIPVQSLFRVSEVHFGEIVFNDAEFGIRYIL